MQISRLEIASLYWGWWPKLSITELLVQSQAIGISVIFQKPNRIGFPLSEIQLVLFLPHTDFPILIKMGIILVFNQFFSVVFFCTIVETKSKTSLVLKRMHFQCFLILFNAVFVEHSLLSIKSSFVLHLFRRALCASVISQDILILAWLNTSLKIFSYCRTLEFYYNSVIAPSFLLFMELFFLEWFFLSSTNNCLISWQQGYVDCQLFSNLSNIYLLFPCRSWPLTFWSTVWLDLRLPWFITGSSEPRGPEQSRLCQLCSWNW